MTLTGKMLIGQQSLSGHRDAIRAINPATDTPLEPAYAGGDGEQVEQACALAWAAFDTYRETALADRARFLETIADTLEALGDELVERASAETGLPSARIQGERGRTCGQLRAFARTMGMPPYRYHQRLRIARAAELLATSDMRIIEIALAVGYETPQALARVFVQQHAMTPSEWRRRHAQR